MTNVRTIACICFIAIYCIASDLPTTYQQAAALGDAQETQAPTRDYFSRTLLPYYGHEYASVLRWCFSNVSNPDDRPFSFVVAIGSDGRVLRVYNNTETNIYLCLRETLTKDVFPTPPVSPYYLHIDMNFTNAIAPGQNPTSTPAGTDKSLGSAARRFRAEKPKVEDTAVPDWASGPPRINNEPISDAQLVGWVAGGVPPQDVISELRKRGIAFTPSSELNELLQNAGADTSLAEELSKTQRSGSSEQNPGEMKTLSEIVAAKGRKDYRRALKEAVTLIKQDSKNPGLYILIGSLLDRQEEWAGMAGAFSAAIQLDRDFAFSHGELSLACYKMQQPCARSEAERMLAIQPRSSDGHKYLGLAYEMVGELQLALAEYQTALSLGSRAPELLYFDIGRAKVLGHDLNGALAPFRQSAEINPTFWRGFAALGDTYVDLGNIDQGLLNLRKAKTLAPDRPEIRQNIGAALCNSGRYTEAIPEFEDLLQLDPDWNMARFCLAKSLRAVGRLDEANKVLEEYKRQEALP